MKISIKRKQIGAIGNNISVTAMAMEQKRPSV